MTKQQKADLVYKILTRQTANKPRLSKSPTMVGLESALKMEEIKKWVPGVPKKVVFVADRLINFIF